MLYIRSVLVGIATAFVTILVSVIAWIVMAGNQLHELHRQFPQAEISFDLRSMLGRPSIVWLIGPLAFIGGFYWNLRRHSR